jgi:hypothetical protein
MGTASNMNKSFEINQICLYSTKELIDKNCSAYFLFTSEDGKSWAGLSTEDLAENLNVLIDWEMSIMNAGGNE